MDQTSENDLRCSCISFMAASRVSQTWTVPWQPLLLHLLVKTLLRKSPTLSSPPISLRQTLSDSMLFVFLCANAPLSLIAASASPALGLTIFCPTHTHLFSFQHFQKLHLAVRTSVLFFLWKRVVFADSNLKYITRFQESAASVAFLGDRVSCPAHDLDVFHNIWHGVFTGGHELLTTT